MTEIIILKKNPRIEFQFQDDGFNLLDSEKEENSGFYSYSDLQSLELNKAWYPTFATVLRGLTWVLNGVPYYPDAESCKNSTVTLHFKKSKIAMWLTDMKMVRKAKSIVKLLKRKASQFQD